MNLTLLWCWKEWRAQRALLAAYSGLVFASLCCVFLLVSGGFWERAGGSHVLGWFVAAGVIGVITFAVPQLVRGECGVRDDTFVRRLPGALLPAFLGKLLFLVLVAVVLPLLGLVLGELLLTATGHRWDDLFPDTANAYAEVLPEWPVVLIYGGWALPFVPWVWLLGTWLPGGRMAIGGTALLALLLGLAAFAIVRPYQGLATTLAWQPWALASVPFGIALAGISWVRGRRGGGNLRSACIGLSLFALGLLPPAGWLISCIHEYHHPDLEHTACVNVDGLSPDGRWAIGHATSNGHWDPVTVRIDLQSGVIEQIAGIRTMITSEVLGPVVPACSKGRRYWQLIDSVTGEREVFDLCAGERRCIEIDFRTQKLSLPEGLREQIADDQRAIWPFRTVGGGRAAVVGNEILFEQADGSVQREPWPTGDLPRLLFAAGHGVRVCGRKGALYDLTRRRIVAPRGIGDPMGWAVRGIWIVHEQGTAGQWRRFDPESGSLDRCPELKNGEVIGLLDDDQLLCTSVKCNELFLYRPADRVVTHLSLPEPLRDCWWSTMLEPTPDSTDPRGRVVLPCRGFRREGRCVVGCLVIDPAIGSIEARMVHAEEGALSRLKLLAMTDGCLLVGDGQRIMRIDSKTSARTVLFPRQR